jgi:poly(A) polymerase
MRFFGHSDLGAEMAGVIMRRLRFSARETRAVQTMIAAHLRPVQLGQHGRPSARAIYKYFRDTGEAGIDTLFLSLADHLATVGPRVNIDHFKRHVAHISYMLEQRFGGSAIVAPDKLIDGDELMAEFGLSPGPLLGRILEAVREGQAIGEVTDHDSALAFARAHLESERRSPGGAE